jgi:MAF protein
LDIKDQKIILASSSPYRKELLKRLGITFTTVSPEVNERYFQDELISDYVLRLAKTKAESIVSKNDSSLIIAADQALQCDKKILGKPGNYNKAKEQLIFMSNRSLTFYTGLCLINTETKIIEEDVVSFRVDFRKLTESEIENYLVKEKPYDCVGSFKSEKLGISLLKKMNGDDPTALIGLPLIRLCKMLRNQGVDIP